MDGTRTRKRERYEPPVVRKVKIVAGELAVAACKTRAVGSGPTFGGCFRSNCKTTGS
jgi:hypothetical protein